MRKQWTFLFPARSSRETEYEASPTSSGNLPINITVVFVFQLNYYYYFFFWGGGKKVHTKLTYIYSIAGLPLLNEFEQLQKLERGAKHNNY